MARIATLQISIHLCKFQLLLLAAFRTQRDFKMFPSFLVVSSERVFDTRLHCSKANAEAMPL